MRDVFWSDFRMADGSRPGGDEVIVVDSDINLIFDTTDPVTIQGLVVYGSFEVADDGAAHALTTDWAVVAGDGTFRVGAPDDPYASDFTLTLAGKDNSNDVDLRDYPDGSEDSGGCPVTGGATCNCPDTDANGRNDHFEITNNNAFLMAMGKGASIEIHVDDAAKESWTQLDATLAAGQNTMRLTEETGWEVGDRIAVASTDFDLDQAEEFTITAVSADGLTVTLDRPAAYMHYGEIEFYDGGARAIDMRAEVALLSRDVTIQGDIDYDEGRAHNQQLDQYGGHTMVMHGGEMYISGAEFAYMGQAGILGRYPTHWHLSEDVSTGNVKSDGGQYILNSSFHHSFNNGITIHGAENALVRDNVIVETVGHGVFLEDGSEIGNRILDNLAFGQRKPGLFNGSPGGNQDEVSSFWLENGDNIVSGNHAAGSEDTGFFFDLRGVVQRPSRSVDSLADNASRNGPTEMVDNVAHSSNRAFFLNHADLVQDINPSGDDVQAQRVAPWTVDDFTAYKIDGRGLYVRGVEGVFTDVKMAEVGEGTRFRLNQGIEDALIVGRSQGNIGTPITAAELAEGRSLPFGSNNFSGHRLYDGPGGIEDVHFDGFYDEADFAIDRTNAVHKSTLHYVEGLTWGPEETMARSQRLDLGVNTAENQQAAEMLVDLDGSLTGIEGGAILTDEPNRKDAAYGFNRSENALIFEEWGAVASPFTDVDFIGLMNVRVVNEDGDYKRNTPYDVSGFEIDVERSDGIVLDNLRVGTAINHRQTAIVDGYSYEMTLRGDPPQFHFWMSDVPQGGSVIFTLNGLREDAYFYLKNPNTREITDIREVSSMEMLEASPDTAIFRDLETGETHIKFVAEMFHGWDFAKPQETRNDALTGGVIVNVDQRPGSRIDLAAIQYDDPVSPPAPNTAPSAADDTLSLAHGASATLDVLANDTDADGDPLIISAVDAGDGVRARIVDGEVRIRADDGFAGRSTVTYTIDDGAGGADIGTIAVEVAQPEPVAIALALIDAATDTRITAMADGTVVTLPAGDLSALTITATADSEDVESISFALQDGATKIESVVPYALFGDVRGDMAGGTLEVGSHTLTVIAYSDDRAGGIVLGERTITFEIAEEIPDLPPTASDHVLRLAADSAARSVTVAAETLGLDPEGEAVVFDGVDQPANGRIEIAANGSTLIYTPDDGFSGTESVAFTLSEATTAGSGRASGRLTLEVEDAPMPTLSFAVHAVVGEQAALAVLEDGDSLLAEDVGDRLVSIAATTDGPFTGSLYLSIEGVGGRLENVEPYALFGDRDGALSGGTVLGPGSYTLTYEAFAGKDGTGLSLGTETLAFTVEAPVLEATIWTTDSTSDSMVTEVSDGGVIDAALLAEAGPVTIAFAPTDDAPAFASMALAYGDEMRIENVAPYALFGNDANDFHGGTVFGEGTHAIDVTLFSERDGGGTVVETFTFDFDVA
ncbi:MAG: Ig-like domain-containing protein [Pseudomonadota bacterium]